MPVIIGDPFYAAVDELPYNRSGSIDVIGWVREYVRKFRVIVKEKTVDQLRVCAAPLLPRPFAFYTSANGDTFDGQALLIRYTAEQEHPDDWQNWIVTCTYSTQMPEGGQVDTPGFPNQGGQGGQGGPGAFNSPEIEKPDMRWERQEIQEVPKVDLDGNPYVNSALQPFTPAVSFEDAFSIFVVSRNELFYDDTIALKWQYALNSKRFLGADPEFAQLLPITAQQTFRGPLPFWRVTYRIRFKRKLEKQVQIMRWDASIGAAGAWRPGFSYGGWQPHILDAGLCRLQNTGGAPDQGKPTPIIRNSGPISQPVLLNGSGQENPTPVVNGPANAIYFKFRRHPLYDFDELFSNGFMKPPRP